MSAEIIKFGKGGGVKTLTREQYVEDILALGRAKAPNMSALELIRGARESIWREISRIAGEAPEAWEPTERESIPDVAAIGDPGIRKDLADLAALACAADLVIRDMETADHWRAGRAAR